jgi:P27 family predicted phage terminase small subunit
MAGRKPKPTALKLIQGTLRKSRENLREPKPSGDLVEPPSYFSNEQIEVWNYAISNAPKGLLKRLDIAILEIWVIAYVTYRDSAKKVGTLGQVIKSPSGYPIVNPYLSNMNKQAQIMMKASSEMGFTPTSRSKIALVEEAIDDDPWAVFANG